MYNDDPLLISQFLISGPATIEVKTFFKESYWDFGPQVFSFFGLGWRISWWDPPHLSVEQFISGVVINSSNKHNNVVSADFPGVLCFSSELASPWQRPPRLVEISLFLLLFKLPWIKCELLLDLYMLKTSPSAKPFNAKSSQKSF